MKELRDQEFDEIFKNRITEELPDFEEASWIKMEEKLRKKDRFLLYRNASIVLLLLSFGFAFYLISGKKTPAEAEIVQKPTEPVEISGKGNEILKNEVPKSTAYRTGSQLEGSRRPMRKAKNLTKDEKLVVTAPLLANQNHNQSNTQQTPTGELGKQSNIGPPLSERFAPVLPATSVIAQNPDAKIVNEEDTDGPKKTRTKRKIPISLAINVGPDFNSTTSLVGGKTSLAVGVGVGIGITKKISLQTGVNFGHKNYNATAYNYTFNNPNAINTIEQVQAACKVVEIPLRASLKIGENKKRRIMVNAGLSSYLMLKEDYVYKYHPQLNRNDRSVQISNENKHILSVVDLSVTYDVKLKAKNLSLGVEPYLKVPLTGIGAGDVSLKSSGLSLKMSYEFNKNQ